MNARLFGGIYDGRLLGNVADPPPATICCAEPYVLTAPMNPAAPARPAEIPTLHYHDTGRHDRSGARVYAYGGTTP